MTETAAAVDRVDAIAAVAFTGRLVGLRELRDEDLPLLTAWWNDPATAARQVTGPMQARPAGDVAAMFRMWSGNTGGDVGMSVVALDAAGEFGELVGHVTLYGADVKDRCATLAIMIGAPHQGRGLGTDAVRLLVAYGFNELNLHRIQLAVNGDNPAAIAAYRKAGFVEEGRRREAVFRGGRWIDHVQMGILAGEWSQGAGEWRRGAGD